MLVNFGIISLTIEEVADEDVPKSMTIG